ncbi:rho guanine nucleotide exchange factor TIAM2 [Anguilla rostrata]|uniref:rho guanine nucleotide exchange factor TIAM2 n=1 Tax=Anguilla rostrata TaxID=7938 RepID=UPI0030D01B65
MGNSESQYSIQGSRRAGLVLPGKQKPCSLKFLPIKEEALSLHGWWRGGAGGSATHLRAAGSGCQSHTTHPYDSISHGNKPSPNGRLQPKTCEQDGEVDGLHLPPENGYHYYGNSELANELAGRALNRRWSSGGRFPGDGRGSPKVVIRKDGSLRVEFTSMDDGGEASGESDGPVQLLRFSPAAESAAGPPEENLWLRTPRGTLSPPSDPTPQTSKGSSASSDCSWYDWSCGNDADPALSPGGPPTRRAGDARPLGRCPCAASFSDLYRDPSLASTFPAAKDLSVRHLDPRRTPHRHSCVSALDVTAEEECPEARQYASYTLPCRKARPTADAAAAKKEDGLIRRMRRFSDWTGSLSNRKRKLQDSRRKETSECFDSGVDGLTADTSSPSQGSSLLWHPGAAPQPAALCESANGLHGNDALRQNIYQNFMRELETGRAGGGGGGEPHEPSTGTEDTSSDSLGSLERLDLRFEKEQGVVRKAGWLSFKPLLTLHKDGKLDMVPRRKWKQYWVTLKGCTLLFYETYRKSSAEQDVSPRYALLAEDGVVQSVPEHPKKENVFCLSNSYGDVYLFQATNQTDLENWVTAIHSASASMLAKRQGKEDTVRLLGSQTRSLLQKIDMDGKMKKMAELQLSIVSDPKNRKAIESQIQQWEQNLEKFNMDLFRMRCYLASLQGCEQPNPKSLLATASRPSKITLARLGVFSVSSFHALICSRNEARPKKHSLSSLAQQHSTKRRLFSSLKGLDGLAKKGHEPRPSSSQVFDGSCEGQLSPLPPCSSERLDGLANLYAAALCKGSHWDRCPETTCCVYLPDHRAVSVPVTGDLTATDLLSSVCKMRQLDARLHGLRLRRCMGQSVEVVTLAPSELIQDLLYDSLEVFPLDVFALQLSRPDDISDFGFAVTGHVDGCGHSHIFVSETLPDGLAFSEGLRPGDEILVVNGRTVSILELGQIQPLFSGQTLDLTLKREVLLAPPNSELQDPGPPVPSTSQPQLPEDLKDGHNQARTSGDEFGVADGHSGFIGSGLENGPQPPYGTRRSEQNHDGKSMETVRTVCHAFQEGSGGLTEGPKDPAGPEAGPLRPCPRHMSATERLRKVVQELLDTEKSYVKDLSCLFETYLKPLENETFLSKDEMESLFGSLPEMLFFQRVFLQTLEERIASPPDLSTLESPVHFKKLLFSLGGSFLYYADHFKLYSGFCANHIKVQKVLERAKTDQAFKEFLDAKNPTKQHSSTLESYLIKPVQRVLKYPLLLRELVSLTDTDSEEHYHLTEALKAMEKVAGDINEMQKIYEDYGAVFDQLVAEQTGAEKEVAEISMGEFLMHSSVAWLNPFPSLGRMRKDPELTVFVFKRAVILVCRESSKLKKKMTSTRSAHPHGDLDPFKFRWMIPLSALQVRLGNAAGTEPNCIWELIHTKSELEGRPETVFQLCSSVPECKARTVKVIRSTLRENTRRHSRWDGERVGKERLTPLRGGMPTSARIGSSRASWRCSQPTIEISAPPEADEGSQGARADPDPGGRPHSGQGPDGDDPEEPGDCGEFQPTGAMEADFRRLRLAEEEAGLRAPHVLPETTELDPDPDPDLDTPEREPRLVRGHFCPVKRKGSGVRRSQGALLSMREHSRSLDSQTDAAAATPATAAVIDLNALLEREFSVQSLASAVNEDCFYDMADGLGSTAAIPTL